MENVRPLGLPPGLLPPQESGQARPPERPSRAEPDLRGATAGSDRITLSEEGRARARRDVGGSPVENVATGEASRAIRSYQAEAQQAPAFEPPPLEGRVLEGQFQRLTEVGSPARLEATARAAEPSTPVSASDSAPVPAASERASTAYSEAAGRVGTRVDLFV